MSYICSIIIITKKIMIMKASKIEFEIGYNNKWEFVLFFNMTFDESYKQLKQKYEQAIIYSCKVEY